MISRSSLPHVVDHPELLERRRPLRLVEQAQHDRLALDGRQRRDADVEHASRGGGVQRDAAVLRLAALGDVELREHLQARRHRGRHAARDALHLEQHAVDAGAHDERVALRLEVHVARPVLGGREDDRVDEPDERRIGDAVVDLELVLLASAMTSIESRSSELRPLIASLERSSRLISSRMSSLGATASSSCSGVARRSSSTKWMFVGSASATRRRLSSIAYGIAMIRLSTWSGIAAIASGDGRSSTRSMNGRPCTAASTRATLWAEARPSVDERLRERSPEDAVARRLSMRSAGIRPVDATSSATRLGEPIALGELRAPGPARSRPTVQCGVWAADPRGCLLLSAPEGSRLSQLRVLR